MVGRLKYLAYNMIPKHIFQTHKSLEYLRSNHELFKAAFSWYNNKGYTYKFYTDKDCDTFMKQKFPEIYPLYAKLHLPVMKADLWRYCVIYEYGGIYADVDTILLCTPDIFIRDKDLVIAPEHSDHMCQWAFAAPAKSPVLKYVIDHVVAQIKHSFYDGKHFVLNTTGPGAFTIGIMQFLHRHSDVARKLNTPQLKPLNGMSATNIHIFDHDNFHNSMITHLFYGCKSGGWMKERNATIHQKRSGFKLNVFS